MTLSWIGSEAWLVGKINVFLWVGHGEALSLGRLKSLIKRLGKDPDLLEKYSNIIQEQIVKGITERVESSEEDNENRKQYIPHHAVITPEKTIFGVLI